MLQTIYGPEGTRITDASNHAYISSADGLRRALQEQVILEAPAILCDAHFSLHLSLCAGVSGIMERDEVQYAPEDEPTKDIAILTRVGKPVCFKVTGFSEDASGQLIAHLSRRAAQQECMLQYIDTLIPGDIIPAKVTHLETFGAFVDIGCGIVSLLSIDSISVSRISHPRARFSVGDTLFTVVKSIDGRGRIYVSSRELLGTWEENAARFCEGQTVRGVIRSVESYGIFVELAPNLAGLAEHRPDVHAGQSCAVYIKSILPEKMKVKLIIIDAQDTAGTPSPLPYFIDTSHVQHMDEWTYSPLGCARHIGTNFM